MPTVTVSGSGSTTTLVYTTNQSAPYAQALSLALTAGLTSGELTAYPYAGGPIAPGPASGTSGVVLITTEPTTAVAIPTSDSAAVIVAGPASITGGGAGETVIAGSFGLTYTGITPSGAGVSYIAAGDGPNLIKTTPGTTGNYSINTGAGNDTIAVSGNALINAGGGQNAISVTGGDAFIFSEGFDAITGSTVVGGGGTDTVDVGTGQPTINPGTTNFQVFADPGSTAPLLFNAGSGSDTITVGQGGGTVTAGTGGYNILYAGTGGLTGAATTLHGAANGDQLYASGATMVFATAGAGRETISGAGGTPTNGVSVPGSTASDTFVAGSGNDTLIAGAGMDTLVGGSGTALMAAGTGADTFSFTSGTGGKDTITGFKPADTLQLNGYGISTVPAVASGGSTVVTLRDGTMITLTGVSSLTSGQVVLK